MIIADNAFEQRVAIDTGIEIYKQMKLKMIISDKRVRTDRVA